MVTFETVKSEELKFGNNNFIEVALKKAVSEDGENEFISLTRGFFTPNGNKRFKRNFSLPMEKDVIDFVVKKIPEMLKKK